MPTLVGFADFSAITEAKVRTGASPDYSSADIQGLLIMPTVRLQTYRWAGEMHFPLQGPLPGKQLQSSHFDWCTVYACAGMPVFPQWGLEATLFCM
jgi:hypothetical protein